VLSDRGAFIAALFDLEPALLHRRMPPPSQAIEFAFTYVKTHLLPLLVRICHCPTICRTPPATGTSHA